MSYAGNSSQSDPGSGWRTTSGVRFHMGVPLARPPHSAMREHLSHVLLPMTKNFKNLASAAHESDLRILESLYIAKLKPSLNSQRSSYPLTVVS